MRQLAYLRHSAIVAPSGTCPYGTICSVAALALVDSCGDDSGPSGPAEPRKVTLESGHSASATIGLSGGSISTTASNGTQYTLEIPEGALVKPVAITMTPVRAIAGFPVLDGVVAGLEFKPSGLVFATPARLTIGSAASAGSGVFPIAVDYSGDADAFTVGLAVEKDGKIVVPIRHFSGCWRRSTTFCSG